MKNTVFTLHYYITNLNCSLNVSTIVFNQLETSVVQTVTGIPHHDRVKVTDGLLNLSFQLIQSLWLRRVDLALEIPPSKKVKGV